MTFNCDNLIEALRDELQEHGGLLGLFDEQQKAILDRKPEVVLAIQESILLQVTTINQCRKHREQIAAEFAVATGQQPDSPLRVLIEGAAEVVRPLLNALIDEVNQLISRTRRRGQQNQMLLARSIDISQRLLQKLNPGAITKTYSRRGRINLSKGGVGSRYLARS